MIDEQFKELLEEVRGLRHEVSVIDRDLTGDRKDIGDLKVEIAGLKAEVRELRSMVGSNADKVKERVTDALEPAIESVDGLRKEIKKKKTLVIVKKGFLDWLKRKEVRA